MIGNKKAITMMSFLIGGLVFVTTAFADVAMGSGYDKLKNSIKHTSVQMDKELKSFSTEILFTFKDNGKALVQNSSHTKVDVQNQASESTDIMQYSSGKTSTRYMYNDSKTQIWKNSEEENQYYVQEYPNDTNKNTKGGFSDPFSRKEMNEIEKVFDAFIGSLKNYVQVEEKPEGGKLYTGSLSEAQVPALANAVSSFGFKQMMRDNIREPERGAFPKIESDISIQKVSGKAVESKSGILESISGEVVMTGKDKDGVQHELAFEVVMKLTGINHTTVTKPDLTGKKVEKVSRNGFDSKYLGKYKNDIVIEKDGKFVKIGERNLQIDRIEDKRVTGRYFETYKPGFESYSADGYDFKFEMDPSDSMEKFDYKNAAGQQETGQLHIGGNGKVYINLNIEIINENSIRTKAVSAKNKYFDGQLSKVFED